MGKLKLANQKDISPLSTFQGSVQEALDRIGTFIKTLFDTTDDAIFLMDSRHFFLDCNPATLRVFGCTSKEQIIGRNPFFFSPPFQPDAQPSIDKALQYLKSALDGVLLHFEWRHWKLDHTPFDVEVKLNRFFLEGMPFLVAVVRDITARNIAEAERKEFADRLFQEKQFTDRLIESLPGVFYLFDSNLHLVRWNKTFEKDLGYSKEELYGKSLEASVASGAKQIEAIDLARKILKNHEPKETSIELDLLRKDGKIVPYLCSGVLVELPAETFLLGGCY